MDLSPETNGPPVVHKNSGLAKFAMPREEAVHVPEAVGGGQSRHEPQKLEQGSVDLEEELAEQDQEQDYAVEQEVAEQAATDGNQHLGRLR